MNKDIIDILKAKKWRQSTKSEFTHCFRGDWEDFYLVYYSIDMKFVFNIISINNEYLLEIFEKTLSYYYIIFKYEFKDIYEVFEILNLTKPLGLSLEPEFTYTNTNYDFKYHYNKYLRKHKLKRILNG